MVSKAEAKRRRRARTSALAEQRRAVPGAEGEAPKAPRLAAATVIDSQRRRIQVVARHDGLDFLLGRGRITGRQADAGRTYGMLYRTSLITGAAALKSCLDDSPRGSGGGGLPTTELAAAEWIAESRMRLAAARAAIGHHDGMTATLDLVCGRGLHPREITTVQRQTEEIETTLRLALDLLGRHFREKPGRLTDGV
jgi:hypothetical protein